MKDPIQGTLDAVCEVEIRIGQIRLLWAEAETRGEAAVEQLQRVSGELERVKRLTATAQAEAFEVRKENKRLRLDAENGMRRDAETSKQLEVFRENQYELEAENERLRLEVSALKWHSSNVLGPTVERDLEAAHATIWGLVCALTEARADAKSSRDGRNRLRRSNDRVREVLGAKPGESPVDAVNRFALRHNDVVGRVAELERLRVELKNLHAAANLDLRASENKRIAETQAIRAGWAEDREELLQRNRVVVDERDAALARVAELEKKVTEMCKPPEGFLNDWQAARNECAAALFKVVRPGAEPPSQGTYVFNTALAEATEELSALRKDRETLNRVRELAGKERVVIDRLDREVRSLRDIADRSRAESAYQLQRFNRVEAERDAALARVAKLECAIDSEWSPYVRRAAEVKS